LAYGLRITSSCDVPGLPAHDGSGVGDVEVHLNDGAKFPEPSNPEIFYTSENLDESGRPLLRVGRLSDGGYGFFYCDGARFAVDPDGRRIVADWPAGYSLEDASTYLVGPVLAFVLRLRGLVCLHASAVMIEDRAIALVGSAGAGKSTTSAVLAKSGYAVLSDDVVALVEQGDCFRVQPGYPRVNLWPDSVRALFGPKQTLPPITPTWDKRYLTLGQDRFRFESRTLPLGVIYVLRSRRAEGSACRIDSISPPLAMTTLVANTHLNYLLDKEMRSKEFRVLGRLVNSVALRSVEAPDDASRLNEVSEVIAADAKRVFAACFSPHSSATH
jgi:hypothetical protein